MAAPAELFCWKGNWGLPSVNTDCLIVLAYARFSGAPLRLHRLSNPWWSPTGVLPALRCQEGVVSQPREIIIQLRKLKYNADYDLSAKEGADTLAFISLLEEKLMPALVYALWLDPKNYVEVTRRWHAENLPFPLNLLLPGLLRGRQRERLQLGGGNATPEPGDETEKELYRDALECMDLLSQRLGANKFFFGDSPSALDAHVFGHLAPLLKIRLPSNRLQTHLQSLENLSSFCDHILTLYFPNEGVGQRSCAPSAPSDIDSEPYRRRKQLLSVLVATGAMLTYALLTGIVAIEYVRHAEAAGERPRLPPPPGQEEEEQE